MSGIAQFPRPAVGVLNRPRASALLDGDARLTVLRAPHGYGKSTLVAQWAAAHQGEFDERHWLRLRGPADRAELLNLVDAARGTRRLIVAEIVGDAAMDAGLMKRIGGLDSTRTILIAASPGQIPDHWVALAGATLIGAGALAFTREECGLLVGARATAEQAAVVHGVSAGWPALVRILTTRAGGMTDPEASVAGFVRELMEELDEPTRALLEDAAVLGRFTGREIAAIGGPPAARVDELSAELENAGFVMRESSDVPQVWNVLPAIGRFVLNVLEASAPARLRAVRLRTVDLLLGDQNPAGALRQAAAAAEWPRVIEILDAHGYRLMTEHGEVIREVALLMPEDVIAHRPDLMFGRDVGLAMTPAGLYASSSMPDGENATTRGPLDLGGDATRAIVFAMWRRLSRARRTGDYARAMAIRAQMSEAVADAESRIRARNRELLPLLHLQWGVTSVLAGDDEQARDDFRLAFDTPAQDQGEFAQRISAANLGLLAAVAGDLPTARGWLERAAACAPLRGFFAKSGMYGEHVANALIAIESLEPGLAHSLLAITTKTVDRNELWAFHVLANARLAILEQNVLPALTQLHSLRQSRRSVAGAGFQSARLLAVAEAELLLATGASVRAAAVLAGAGDHPLVGATRATQLLSIGDTESATTVAGAVIWAEHAGPIPRAISCLVLAGAALARGREEEALTAFRMGMGFVEEFGLRRILGCVPRASLAQLAALAGAELDLEHVPELYPAPSARAELTSRERLVLSRLAEGGGLAEIASSLFVTRNTLKTQLRSLYRKLGVHNMEDAIAEGQRQGVIEVALD